jgi:hypothetical protein
MNRTGFLPVRVQDWIPSRQPAGGIRRIPRQDGIPSRQLRFILDKASLYLWWRRAESNRRPPACKAGALPTEPRPHTFRTELFPHRRDEINVVGTGGLEPPTSRLSGVRSNHLSYAPT